jgi:hypothetical protein
MGFKARVFSETLILCVFLLLDTRNIVSGKLLPSDSELYVSKCRYSLWQLQVLQDCEQNQSFGGAYLSKLSMALEFKFQVLSRTEGFIICGTLKCIHGRTVHRGRLQVKN